MNVTTISYNEDTDEIITKELSQEELYLNSLDGSLRSFDNYFNQERWENLEGPSTLHLNNHKLSKKQLMAIQLALEAFEMELSSGESDKMKDLFLTDVMMVRDFLDEYSQS